MFHKMNSSPSELNYNVNCVYTTWDNTASQTNTDHPLLFAEAEKTKVFYTNKHAYGYLTPQLSYTEMQMYLH